MTIDSLLAPVVEKLCSASVSGLPKGTRRAVLPSRGAVLSAMESLRSVLFPLHFGGGDGSIEGLHFHLGATLDRALRELEEHIRRSLCFVLEHGPGPCGGCERRAREVTHEFLSQLPEIQRLLATDVAAAYEGDPALTLPDEAIFCYPGILAITNARVAHALHRLGVPLLPRIVTEHAHSLTGIDIHPGAEIGEQFFIDHGTGVVIGETSVLGRHVRLYQGVTLGAKSFPIDDQGKPIKGIARHPVVEDDVIIYSGATILGRITIGRGAVIGGNVWLTSSVAPGARVTQSASRPEPPNP